MRKTYLSFYAFLFVFSAIAFSQTNDGIKNDCDCASLLSELDTKIRDNYVAYHIEVKGKRDFEYGRHLENILSRAKQTSADKCVKVLKEFLLFFEDGHLYIGQTPGLTDNEREQLRAQAEVIRIGETELRKYFQKNTAQLDPIEGIWFSKDTSRFAIYRDEGSKKRDFVAVLLSGPDKNWEPGHVKAEFSKLADGSYDVVYFDMNHFPVYPGTYFRDQKGGAALRRGLILHMPPISWGREYPTNRDPINTIDTNDPRKPSMKTMADSTVLFSIPSHDPEYAPALQELVDSSKESLAKANTLVIDLRGNEGGSSWITNVLMPFVESASSRAPKYWVGDEEVVLSSPDNIRYFEGLEGQGWLPKRLVERLKEHPGELVQFNDPSGKDAVQPNTPAPKELPNPLNVGVLIDSGVSSAAEAFVIRLMRSRKVTVFGRNTAGMIDYRSTSGVSLKSCPHLGIYLGYPMFASSRRLPDGGANKTGIKPDVWIDENEQNPVHYILEYFKSKSAKDL